MIGLYFQVLLVRVQPAFYEEATLMRLTASVHINGLHPSAFYTHIVHNLNEMHQLWHRKMYKHRNCPWRRSFLNLYLIRKKLTFIDTLNPDDHPSGLVTISTDCIARFRECLQIFAKGYLKDVLPHKLVEVPPTMLTIFESLYTSDECTCEHVKIIPLQSFF